MPTQAQYKARAKEVAIKRSKQFAANNKGTAELRRFIRDFDKFPADLRKEMRPMLREAGMRALVKAKANSQWSTRIPSSLRLAISFTKRSAGVTLTSSRIKAPHGRAYAHMGKPGFFRAPTGNPPEPWVRHKARPWFFSASDEVLAKDIDRKIGAVVDSVARSHGFR